MIRIGLGGVCHTIIIIRNPHYPILIMKAPTLRQLRIGFRVKGCDA